MVFLFDRCAGWAGRAVVIALALSLPAGAASPSTEVIGHEKDYTAANAAAARAPSAEANLPSAELHARGGLPRFFAKVGRGERVRVGYFGGSITAGPGWRTQSFEWLQQAYPKASFEMLNAGLGGHGSIFGAFRADTDLVAKRPDVVFVEFSLNDGSDVRDRPAEVAGAVEGIVRKLRLADPDVDIAFVYTVTEEGIQKHNASRVFSNSVSLHERVAQHYGLPGMHLGVKVAEAVAEGKMVFRGDKSDRHLTADGRLIFTYDGSHPNEEGHRWNGEAAIRSLEALARLAGAASAGPRPLPPQVSATAWERAQLLPAHTAAHFRGSWDRLTAADGPRCRRFGQGFYEWFPYLYRTVEPGASMTVRFRGTHVGFRGLEGPDSGVVSISIDGGRPQKRTLFTVYANQHVYVGQPLPALPEGEHTVTWTLLDETPPKEDLLRRKGTDGDLRANPAKYRENSFSAGQILLLGELLPPSAGQPSGS